MKSGECKQIKQGLEAYETYIDRISFPTKPIKLTNEEVEQLKKMVVYKYANLRFYRICGYLKFLKALRKLTTK